MFTACRAIVLEILVTSWNQSCYARVARHFLLCPFSLSRLVSTPRVVKARFPNRHTSKRARRLLVWRDPLTPTTPPIRPLYLPPTLLRQLHDSSRPPRLPMLHRLPRLPLNRLLIRGGYHSRQLSQRISLHRRPKLAQYIRPLLRAFNSIQSLLLLLFRNENVVGFLFGRVGIFECAYARREEPVACGSYIEVREWKLGA